MRISTLGYSIKQGVKNIGRNKMFSIASMATMAACIFLFGVFFSIVINFRYIVDKAEEGVAITVLFDADATDEQIKEIGEKLKSRDDVAEVKYIPRNRHGKTSRKIILERTMRMWQRDLKAITR